MIAKPMYAVSFFVFGALLTGCMSSSSGTPMDSRHVAQLHKGMTRVEVETLLGGPPNSVVMLSDGRRMLNYYHQESDLKPQTYIPVVGLFAGGANVRQQSVQIRLSPEGIVEDFQSNDKSTDAQTNVFGGVHTTERDNTSTP